MAVGQRDYAAELKVWEDLAVLQEAFPYTEEGCLAFAEYCINTLIRGNPHLNRVQADMILWLFRGPRFRMIMAQRGQAKTTITAIYAVFRLIHDPAARILIFSAGGKMAKEISSWVVQIIHGLDILTCMRADRAHGDRASIEGYDINYVLKGANKSPSVKCLGVDSNAQGSRADILIADDIESMKNSRTSGGRELLEELTKEFESICADGDIIYLGTPQSSSSIYNNMPSRGYGVRIWSGRYPTQLQIESYGSYLAPMLVEDIKKNPDLQTGYGIDGTSGAPTCPEMFTDENLIAKEIAQGPAKFQLQYMLNTSLSDQDRFPLKLPYLVVADYNELEGPLCPVWSQDQDNLAKGLPRISNRREDALYWAVKRKYEYRPFERTVMYIDPAGGGRNGDETGYAIVKLIGSHIYILACNGVKGGYEEDSLLELVELAKRYDVRTVLIEKNFGNGAHASMMKPLFNKHHPVELEEVWEAGQKELRIIDVLEPVMARHQLIISPEVIREDLRTVAKYAVEVQMTYSLLYQMAMITRDKGCLRHDDRLDALAGAVRYFTESLNFDTQAVYDKKRNFEQEQFREAWRDVVSRRDNLGVLYKAKKGRNRFG